MAVTGSGFCRWAEVLDGTGHGNGADRGTVDIRVDLETLTKLNNSPAELAGYGPVVANIARQVASRQQRSEWRYTVTESAGGSISDNGTARRRPTIGQRREIEARNPTCVFPGCRMPTTESDIDHRVTWSQDGPTTTTNLAPL